MFSFYLILSGDSRQEATDKKQQQQTTMFIAIKKYFFYYTTHKYITDRQTDRQTDTPSSLCNMCKLVFFTTWERVHIQWYLYCVQEIYVGDGPHHVEQQHHHVVVAGVQACKGELLRV